MIDREHEVVLLVCAGFAVWSVIPVCLQHGHPDLAAAAAGSTEQGAELEWERTGNVMIYEGVTDREVEHALDNHSDRLQSMMFVDTVLTDADGKPARDPDNGKVITEDDGCD